MAPPVLPPQQPVLPPQPVEIDYRARYEAILNPANELQQRGIRKLYPVHIAAKICSIAFFVILGLSIVSLALSTAQKLPPMLPVYTFSGCAIPLIGHGVLYYIKRNIAQHHDVNLEDYEEAIIGYIPPKKKE